MVILVITVKIFLVNDDDGSDDDYDYDLVTCCRHEKMANPPWVAKLG